MWAGSRIEFLRPIPLGGAMMRTSQVVAIAEKTGRTGPMILVTLHHEIKVDDRTAIREDQDLVFRGYTSAAAPGPASAGSPASAAQVRGVVLDPVRLFRYSALTFNAHRIHYDRDYARQREGYPGLVVQGPYLATLLLAHWLQHRPGHDVAAFTFRAVAPAFDGHRIDLCLNQDEVEARTPVGQICLTATVRGQVPAS